uniref:Heat shock factor protein-like n=1 Tax=Saccoglossus kowalevskii TaxID=10224 RepID=A0ABM0MYU6_SACKO|nr:PREDICTED: heat shock factor protein-like [Saccoglossus kowalevskii]
MDIHHGSTIPAFLNKLISLLEDESTNDLIRWGQNGTSFLVCDQGRFAKEVLPNYFKHNNIASFIRQLNMYGFRKLVNVESGGLKVERDETEFCHPYFIRGRLELLEQIKRKISSSKGDEVKVKQGDVSLILNDVKQMKGKQGDMSNKLDAMKRENQALWREVKELRQKHTKQQQIVNRLIEFLLSLVKPARSGLKRKMPLMINHATESPTSNPPKYSRHLAFQPSTSTISDYDLQSLQPSDSEEFETTEHSNGPIISDVTDLISPNEVDENQKESGFVEDHTNENEVEKLAEAFLPEAQSRLLLDKILDAPVVSEPSIDSALTSLPMGIDLEPPETLLEDDAATSDGNPNNQDSANLSTSNKSDDRDMTVALSNAHASSAPVRN